MYNLKKLRCLYAILQYVILRYIVLVSLIIPDVTFGQTSQVLAFPGAEGYGKQTSGGRGGKLYVVTNLNDSGPGSLREAIDAKGPRMVIFDVSGYIDLKSKLIIRHDSISILGHSAPGIGICLRYFPTEIRANNVLIRYIRFRMGDTNAVEGDALSCVGQRNVIIDHCSLSWGTDEVASFYDNTNFTLQHSIISESLDHSVHHKGYHGYAGIWGGMGATFYRNLIMHHRSRTPRFNGSRYHSKHELEMVDFINNVVYNWSSGIGVYGGERGTHNIIGNYFMAGPATKVKSKLIFFSPTPPYGRFFIMENRFLSLRNSRKFNLDEALISRIPDAFFYGAFGHLSVTAILSADIALISAYNTVGASFKRDKIDSRLISELINRKFTYGRKGIIDSQAEVGGWPSFKEEFNLFDSDNDGIWDDWEIINALDSNNSMDSVIINPNSGYSYLEEFLEYQLNKEKN
jgi:hypothetical protein